MSAECVGRNYSVQLIGPTTSGRTISQLTRINMELFRPQLSGQLQRQLTVESSASLSACRDKIKPLDFVYQVASGYDGLRGMVDELLRRHQSDDWRADFEFYLKQGNNAPQRDYVILFPP